MSLDRFRFFRGALIACACLPGAITAGRAVETQAAPWISALPAHREPADGRDFGPLPLEFRLPPAGPPQSALLDAPALNATIVQAMADYHIAGLAGWVVKDDRTAWHHSYGFADVDRGIPVTDATLFMLGSISKTFVATAVMQLWERGLLGLDDDINVFLPFPVVNPSYPDVPITMRMILAHVSSIARNDQAWLPLITWGADSPIPLGEFLEEYLVPGGIYYAPLNYNQYAPGTSGEYSNIAYSLAAYIVERVSGQSFEQYCQENIFAPLRMHESSWFLAGLDPDHIAMPTGYADGDYFAYGQYGYPVYPAGQLRTSSQQLARHLTAFMLGGQINGVRILRQATVDTMRTVQYPGTVVFPGFEWGLGWYRISVAGKYLWGHTGGIYGVITYMYCDPIERYGYLFLSNVDYTNGHHIIDQAMYNFARSLPSLPSSVGSEERPEVPRATVSMLAQSAPNPLNLRTTITYTLPEVLPVTLSIHDARGRRVITLCDEVQSAGAHSCAWDGTDQSGHRISSGVYYYRLRAGSRCETKALTVLR